MWPRPGRSRFKNQGREGSGKGQALGWRVGVGWEKQPDPGKNDGSARGG